MNKQKTPFLNKECFLLFDTLPTFEVTQLCDMRTKHHTEDRTALQTLITFCNAVRDMIIIGSFPPKKMSKILHCDRHRI
jgi:hypothetical protein